MFRHPKYYKELRKRALDERNRDLHVRPISGSVDSATDQAISQANSTRGLSDVRPGPGPKRQATSKQQATSRKPQAPSDKPQAPSSKLQA
jgi:hypothetical protein